VERTEWSAITGSVGTLIVTRDAAGLWVDSRYWTQAEYSWPALASTDEDSRCGQPCYVDWLAGTLKSGDAVGVDATSLLLPPVARSNPR